MKVFMQKALIYYFLLLMIIGVGCKKIKLGSDNSVFYHGMDYWISTKDSSIVNSNCELMKLQFLNNPYELDSSYNMTLTIDTDGLPFLIYRGKFMESFDVCIPDTILSMKYTSPKVGLFKDNKSFLFINKSYIKIRPDDKFVYIVFFPEKYSEGSCIMFSQKLPLN